MTADVPSKPYDDLWKPFEAKNVAILETLITEKTPFFERMHLPPLQAEAAYLLNALIQRGRKRSPRYLSFFASSACEAIAGAIKLVRHDQCVRARGARRPTAVYDPSNVLAELLDPLRRGVMEALAPGILFCDCVDDLTELIDSNSTSSILLRAVHKLSADELNEILRRCKGRAVRAIVDESSTNLLETGLISSSLEFFPDVIVLGENLTDHRVPAGCFMMTAGVYKVWNSFKNCKIHSNTYGGNNVAATHMLDVLKRTPSYREMSPKVTQVVDDASRTPSTAGRLYARYCSPKLAMMLKLSSLNKNIVSAFESRLTIRVRGGTTDVIDAAGAYGVNLRGHNREDIIPSVLRTHDPQHDYWDDLTRLLRQKTGLAHLLPAVSGATAVEAAITLALLANAPKKTIVALKGGYGGKTLIALLATARDASRTPFEPLYPHVVYIDPFADDVEETLTRQLETEDVALVLMEPIQGEGGVRPCPARLLDFVAQNRSRYGYLIALDEVQTGLYRTGKLFNHQGKVEAPDLVAVGKALSDMVFPVAGTLASEETYQRAREKNASTVSILSRMYRCQFGAHVGLHAVESGERLQLADRARTMGERLKSRLQEIAADVDVVKEVRGEGLMIGLEFDAAKLPRLFGRTIGALFAAKCANDPVQPILVAFTPDNALLVRYLPPLTISEAEVDAVAETTERSLRAGWPRLLAPIAWNVASGRIWRA